MSIGVINVEKAVKRQKKWERKRRVTWSRLKGINLVVGQNCLCVVIALYLWDKKGQSALK